MTIVIFDKSYLVGRETQNEKFPHEVACANNSSAHSMWRPPALPEGGEAVQPHRILSTCMSYPPLSALQKQSNPTSNSILLESVETKEEIL